MIGEDIELVTDLQADVENSKLDPDQLTQVIMNLAVNARDAMPNGGELHILDCHGARSTKLTPASIRRCSRDATWRCRSAIQVPESQRRCCRASSIPFSPPRKSGKGTGLGLAIVYGIVKQSGGYIWVYSEPGHGTTFKLYFPVTTAPVDPPVTFSRD